MNNKRAPVSRVPISRAASIDQVTDGQVNDVGGFDAFIRQQYHGLVQFLRRRTVTEQDAEDAAQESMAKLLRYRESEPASAWKWLLYRIAINVVHDQFRVGVTHSSMEHVALDEQELSTSEHSPEEQAVYEQEVARLIRAIMELPPKCRRVHLLKRVHGLTRAQIAERCGISVKMVEKHLSTALTLLKRNVKVGNSPTDTFK